MLLIQVRIYYKFVIVMCISCDIMLVKCGKLFTKSFVMSTFRLGIVNSVVKMLFLASKIWGFKVLGVLLH